MGEHMDRQFFDEIVLRTSALEALKERQADMGIPENENPPEEEIREFLLQDDKLRANIMEYNGPMLDDINGGGHWELWPYEGAENIIKLDSALVARDPESSILDGVVGIDFGTKSTVVVQQGETNQSMPMRVGIGDYRKKPETHHYENPTILEFIDLQRFKQEYEKGEGRPYTRWADVTVSHTAFNALKEATKSSNFDSFFHELKEWAGEVSSRSRVIIDKNSNDASKNERKEILKPYKEIRDGDFDPIEIYAYYLGLYINNQRTGIYMNYYLSFPVTYEKYVRDKILKSFEKGLKRSFPPALLDNEEAMSRFRIMEGASEPAAYAITALQEYNFDPEPETADFYGVFDFGGGTSDFDFGLWRQAKEDVPAERRYDYVIEHFGAGGDRHLGGENLLELLAFHVFKNNVDTLREQNISFILPPECEDFPGSESVISKEGEGFHTAKTNMTALSEKLRPLWERHEGYEKQFQDEVTLTLWAHEGSEEKQIPNFSLSCNVEKLEDILRTRIKKGVENFFGSLKETFGNNQKLASHNKINIFLAGNSSKSPILRELFEQEIEKIENEILGYHEGDIRENHFFKIYPPLGSEESHEIMGEKDGDSRYKSIESPTGKTGVAFGLIEARKGSKIKIIDKNINKDYGEILFKYYLGIEKRKRFKSIISREQPYHKWYEFIDASVDTFELLYSDQPRVCNNETSIKDEGIKKKSLRIDHVDEDAMVYIRRISPTEIEYTVGMAENGRFDAINNAMTGIKKVVLE